MPSCRTQIHFGLLCVFLLWMMGCKSNVDDSAASKADSATGTAVEGAAESVGVTLRQNISDVVQDPNKVAAYRQALETMRTHSSADPSTVEFRTSLLFWANTHGYFGLGGQATSFAETVNYRRPQCLEYFQDEPYKFSKADAEKTCQNYYDAAGQEYAPDAFSDGIWGTCQHTPHSCEETDLECKEIRATPRFLPWHRLYLFYYERTLRKYSGSESFALPYWDYFDYPAENSTDGKHPNLWLPPLVSEGGSVPANTFFDELRTMWLNEQKTSMSPDNASAKEAFAEPTFVDFSNTLEGTPHGAMHCAVGNGCTAPHIGWVPVAGNDPVFYMHHANIDRLWQCWMNEKADGATIDLDWAKANLGMPDAWYDISFVFADENGQRVTKTIADAFSPEVLAVRYAEDKDCRYDSPTAAPLAAERTVRSVQDKIAKSDLVLMSGKIDLQTKPTQLDLRPEPQVLQQNQRASKGLLESTGDVAFGVWLVLENIVVKEAPAYTYNVYISSKAQPENRALVTRFSFFGFGDHGHGHRGPTSLGTKRYYLNDDIREIGITSVEDISVHLVPSNAVTGEPLDREGESLISIDSVRLITHSESN